MDMNENKVSKFLEKMADDKEFSDQVCQMDTALDVQKLAKTVDLDLTLEDILAAKDLINKALDQHREGALSEDDLDQVAGGITGNPSLYSDIIMPGLPPNMPGRPPRARISIPGLNPVISLKW